MMCDVIPEQCITRDWVVSKQSGIGYQCVCFYYVKDYSIAPGKTAKNYSPPRDLSIAFDSIVICQLSGSKSRSLGSTLSDWISRGFSTHFLIPQNNVIVQWVDPRMSMAQSAGRWNSRSIEILMLTDDNQEASASQIAPIGKICAIYSPSTALNTNIKYLGSHQEAQGSGYEGKVTNIQEIRNLLGLGKLPSY